MTPEQEAKIRERAYQLWEADGRPDGRHLEHWSRAEAEVLASAAAARPRRRAPERDPAGVPPGKPRRSPSTKAGGGESSSPRRKST